MLALKGKIFRVFSCFISRTKAPVFQIDMNISPICSLGITSENFWCPQPVCSLIEIYIGRWIDNA